MERIIERVGVVPVDIALEQSTVVFCRTEGHIDGTSCLLTKLHKDNGRDGSDTLEKGDDQHAEEHCKDSDLESPLLLGNLVP